MVSVDDRQLRGGGSTLKKAIWNAAKSTIEEWTGQQLTECSLYGIRIYEEGAVLSPHVDRLPLVSSAIINVAQDVDEPWPIEVYGHDGVAHNVTMEPGDMVLYESHSVIHGRPFPLKGRFFANIFIHFEPVGHTLRHTDNNNKPSTTMHLMEETPDARYRQSVEMGHGGHENMGTGVDSLLDQEDHNIDTAPPVYDSKTGRRLPPYVVAGSPQADAWLRENQDGWTDPNDAASLAQDPTFETGSTYAHAAAQTGDLDTLQELWRGGNSQYKADLVKEDKNGWQPIHEGARAGHPHVVNFLVEQAGANVNHRTNEGIGGTPLFWARNSHGNSHPVVKLLEKMGALDIGPEL
jgi:prolyl 4-hydroxylase